MSAWLSTWDPVSAEIVTTETDPRWHRLGTVPPKDIVKGSDDWNYYTVYDCSTQTYHYPNGETEYMGTTIDSSIRRSHADPSAPSYTATPSFNDSNQNFTSSTSADTPSASSFDLPSEEVMVGGLPLIEC